MLDSIIDSSITHKYISYIKYISQGHYQHRVNTSNYMLAVVVRCDAPAVVVRCDAPAVIVRGGAPAVVVTLEFTLQLYSWCYMLYFAVLFL